MEWMLGFGSCTSARVLENIGDLKPQPLPVVVNPYRVPQNIDPHRCLIMQVLETKGDGHHLSNTLNPKD